LWVIKREKGKRRRYIFLPYCACILEPHFYEVKVSLFICQLFSFHQDNVLKIVNNRKEGNVEGSSI